MIGSMSWDKGSRVWKRVTKKLRVTSLNILEEHSAWVELEKFSIDTCPFPSDEQYHFCLYKIAIICY